VLIFQIFPTLNALSVVYLYFLLYLYLLLYNLEPLIPRRNCFFISIEISLLIDLLLAITYFRSISFVNRRDPRDMSCLCTLAPCIAYQSKIGISVWQATNALCKRWKSKHIAWKGNLGQPVLPICIWANGTMAFIPGLIWLTKNCLTLL